MSTPFFPIGPAVILEATTAGNVEINFGSAGNPNIVRVWNGDSQNVQTVLAGYGNIVDAEYPTPSTAGVGVVLEPFGAAEILVDSTYQTGNLWVSSANNGTTAQIWISAGVLK